jgi:hypothetical protein
MNKRSGARILVLIAFVLAALTFAAGDSFAESHMKPEAQTVAAFEKMKSLVGEWQGKSSEGKAATVTYTLISDKSALMEKLGAHGESEMITMYHPDGGTLMMTHYCSAHNQPRMRSNGGLLEGKEITLDFVDATNLSAPDAGHMKKLVVTFVDKNHFTQDWTWSEKGNEGTTTFNFERRK